MPEYLAPGVYMEEVSFRSKSIEGVPTSTTGFAGMARSGPVQYPNGPTRTDARLITSFTEFEQVYGGLEPLRHTGQVNTQETERLNYLAHAARVFFLNGGKRLYVSRVFTPRENGASDWENWGIARLTVPVGLAAAVWRARWPGRLGNVIVQATPMRTRVAPVVPTAGAAVQVRGVRHGAVIEVLPGGSDPPAYTAVPTLDTLRTVLVQPDGTQQFYDQNNAAVALAADALVNLVELKVSVEDVQGSRPDFYDTLAAHPSQTRYIGRILQLEDPEDENAVVALDWTPPVDDATDEFAAARLAQALLQATADRQVRLEGGHDGAESLPDDLAGAAADPDDATQKATGLQALQEVDDIAIVALPDAGGYADAEYVRAAADRLIAHAEMGKYRIAVVDGPRGSSLNEIREFRGHFDSKYAALYHPWIEILDPLQRPAQGAPPQRLRLPPSGFVTGIYARTDIERGVHKAPANEVVRGLTRFEANINKERQDVLNPEGINALRFFEGRGSRVWGARTMSSDPEWKYVNVRRLFIYIEHSIDKATQWAVFEPNNRQLWDNIRSSVEDFLLNLWLAGALLGDKPEEAYFVRCDRTTMTQNDLDNGRLICLVGVAPTKPAEFVIFRVGLWTADAKRS